MFKCPAGYKFCVNKNADGFFIGVNVDGIPACQITDYALSSVDAMCSDKYSEPIRLMCQYADCPAKKLQSQI